MDQLEHITTIEDHEKFLVKHGHILSLKDSVYSPNFDLMIPYTEITDERRIYIQSNKYIVYVGKSRIYYFSKNDYYSSLNKTTNKPDLTLAINSFPHGYNSINSVDANLEKNNMRVEDVNGNFYHRNIYNFNDRCYQDRALHFIAHNWVEITSWQNPKPPYDSYSLYRPRVDIKFYSEKKNLFCNWKEYKTNWNITNYEFEFYVFENCGGEITQYSTTCTIENRNVYVGSFTYSDSYGFHDKFYSNDQLKRQPDLYENYMNNYYGFDKLNWRGTHTGMNGSYLEIDID